MSEPKPLDMTARYGDSDLCNGELLLIGVSFMNWLNLVNVMGHTSPGHSLDYTTAAPESDFAAIMRDFVAWTSGRQSLVPGCADRLRWLLAESKWGMHAAIRVAEALELPSDTAA